MELNLILLVIIAILWAWLLFEAWQMSRIVDSMRKTCDRMIKRCEKMLKIIDSIK